MIQKGQKKLELTFSTTKDGDRFDERVVRHLIAGYAELHAMDGYTLNKALTGYWRGVEEDSYSLTIICFSEYSYNKAFRFLVNLSNVIKRLYQQDETLLTETDITVWHTL